MLESKENRKIYQIAVLVSISCVLQIAESLVPHPIPGLRLGLANMLTVIALVTLGFEYALEIAVLRTVLSSFIMGTFLSPAFILSFFGAVVSTVVMGFFFWASRSHRHLRLSIAGISIIGALSHNLVQLYLAFCLLVKHRGIFVFLPWLCLGAVVTGWITGAIAVAVCRKMKEAAAPGAVAEPAGKDLTMPIAKHYSRGESFLHRLPAEAKIAGLFVLSLSVLFFNDARLYLCLFSFLVVLIISSRSSFLFLFSRARRYSSLMLVAFSLPVFFNSGAHVLSTIGYFEVTSEGLSMGALFASRILFLILASSLLMRTTSPEEMTNGLTKLLSPLQILGISKRRAATILSLSWAAIPAFWEMAGETIRAANLNKIRNARNLIPFLSDLIVKLYGVEPHH